MARGVRAGSLGDQQAAMLGQRCKPHEAKNTYGTGSFILLNTGTEVVMSEKGLLTTSAYQLGPDQPAYYALEGAIAVAGAGVSWLRDNLEVISTPEESGELAASVPNTAGVECSLMLSSPLLCASVSVCVKRGEGERAEENEREMHRETERERGRETLCLCVHDWGERVFLWVHNLFFPSVCLCGCPLGGSSILQISAVSASACHHVCPALLRPC